MNPSKYYEADRPASFIINILPVLFHVYHWPLDMFHLGGSTYVQIFFH